MLQESGSRLSHARQGTIGKYLGSQGPGLRLKGQLRDDSDAFGKSKEYDGIGEKECRKRWRNSKM